MATRINRSIHPPPKQLTFDNALQGDAQNVTNPWYDWALNIAYYVNTVKLIVDGHDNDLNDEDGNVQRLLTDDVSVFAPRMTPTITDGCEPLQAIEFAATQPNFHALPFLPSVDTSADFHAMLPFFWAGKNFEMWIYWGHGAGATGFDTRWELTANTTYDDESVILDFVPGVFVTDTGGTSGNLYIGRSGIVPIASYENEEGSLVSMRIIRRGTAAEDTLDIPAYLLAVRFVLEGSVVTSQPTDPYWANVSLLIQDEADAGTTLTNRATSGGTAAITSGLVWDDGVTHLGGNTLHQTEATPSTAPFQSLDAGSAFTRASGEDMTVEVWVRWTTLPALSIAQSIWYWRKSGEVDRLAHLYFTVSGGLRYRVSGTEHTVTTLAADTWHFVQVTTIGDTFYVDVGGTQYATGAALPSNASGTYNVWVGGETPGANTNDCRIGPLRWTKGVARARGVVPTDLFPTS